MGICHSKKIKKPEVSNPKRPEVQPVEKPPSSFPANEEEPKRKSEETEKIENVAEITDETHHKSYFTHLNREISPSQLYKQHINAIMRGFQDSKPLNCEFEQTEPVPIGDGVWELETYGSYGKKTE